ncbi:MAG: SdpI family protein [Xanthomonadales bacterium]|nr:SdpI family protein [Xanthomonadales bacterium]
MKTKKTRWVSLVFVLIAVAAGVWLYPKVAAQVPTHWNLQGQVNGWMPRFWAVAMWPLLIAALALLTWLLPVISPRKFEIKPFVGIYNIVMLVVQAFVLVLGVSVLLAAAGHALDVPLVATLATAVLLMVLGNYLGKLRKNFFIGIRTPWTLASDAVWERTHRFAGVLYMAVGVLVVICVLAHGPRWLPIALILIATASAVIYSYVIYRRLERRHPQAGEKP